MKGIELKPLVKSDHQILEDHSNESWTPEYLYSQEFDALFQQLFNQYLHGEFRRLEDTSDFEAFRRMFRELKQKRNELEDRFFPERIDQRAEERARITEEEEMEGCRECYEKLRELSRKKRNSGGGDDGFSWKNLFFGCFRRVQKVDEMKRKAELFKY
ncbi:hypothetical protein GCK72_020169 [Caenorhabditis remanei]|uniref:Uncharacterized protein n=1 Tax=Caenorhabditis remanei TaxID=31234 RepID=A0A6A5GGI8_CAERE|nr:hypothetical protein GCK72_020169 [Caenorhabditis remanei]KAF1753612.1 hypothetical protein GCK72_020169 [Caenorhabditis remanei]